MAKVKVCPKCKSNRKSNILWDSGYVYKFGSEYNYDCPIPGCGGKLIDTILDEDEYSILAAISKDATFFDAMIELKEKDIIEFNSRMAQFRAQAQQQRALREDNVPKCPTCHSTNIKKIGGANKIISIKVFGVYSSKINKTFKCENCGYTW